VFMGAVLEFWANNTRRRERARVYRVL